MTHTDIEEKMRLRLDSKRFSHVLAVVERIKYLASKTGVCEGDAVVAALLHDCTKNFSFEEHLRYAAEHKLFLSEDDIASPEILHARTGALMARLEFGASDTVACAIHCHTTGKEDMSLFEKLLFIADFTEETRVHESCITERKTLDTALENAKNTEREIDASVLRILENTVSYLTEKKVFIHSDTCRAIDFLKSRGEL